MQPDLKKSANAGKKKKRKIDLRHSERSLLTDTLPFETPISFTNESLASIAVISKSRKLPKLVGNLLLHNKKDEKLLATRPLNFNIKKNQYETRRLSIPHPRSQYYFSSFYEEYGELIANACSRSEYSLRYPSRVATHFVDSRYSNESKAPASSLTIDEDPAGFKTQRRWASTYFSYQKYNLSHKFFESEEFLDLEKKHCFLMTLDVSRCFESIYTHTIEWAVRGKSYSKDNLSSGKSTFESKFDKVIRSAKWDETHGIIVGPEFSRVFAEVILQSCDREIRRKLANLGMDIQIRRYVDDFFVFSNRSTELDVAKQEIISALGAVNLHLNESKSSIERRPFISNLSSARHKIGEHIDRFFDRTTDFMFLPDTAQNKSPPPIDKMCGKAIDDVRRVSIDFNVPYEKLSSFALSVINSQLERFIKKTESIAKRHYGTSNLSWILAVIRISQFLHSIDERVTTSLKLGAIYKNAFRAAEMLKAARSPIEGQILDHLRSFPQESPERSSADDICRINHLCIVDSVLSSSRGITPQDILYAAPNLQNEATVKNASYFELTAGLLIGRKKVAFRRIKELIEVEAYSRLVLGARSIRTSCELTLLYFDFLSCPHIENDIKFELLKSTHLELAGEVLNLADAEQYLKRYGWISFTDWHGQKDLAKLLERKELTPAYD